MTATLTGTAEELSLHLWKWLTIHRKTRAALFIFALCTVCSFFNQHAALAADGGGNSDTFFLPLDKTTDSHGVPIEAYSRLPLDYGRATYPLRLMRGFMLAVPWAIYTMATYVIIAAVDFILGMTWLDWLLSPFTFLAGTISTTVGKLVLIPTALTFSALAGAILWARGAKGTAIAEVFIALVLSAVAVSPAANPITYLDGDNSAISRSVEYGNEVGNGITTDPSQEKPNEGSAINSAIIDVALRTPAQVLSWGKTLDGQCSDKFDDEAKKGSDAEKLRKAVNGCDKDAKEANETDSLTALAYMAIFWLSFAGLWATVLVMLFFIVKDTFFALLNAINVTWRAPLAVFPWGARYGFYNSFAQMMVNVVAIGACITITAVYLWLYGKVTAFTGGTAMIFGNIILGVIALLMAYTLFKMKRNGKSLAQALSERLSTRGVTRGATQKQPSKLGATIKGFARSGAKYGKKALVKKGTISATPKVAAGILATGGTAAAVGAVAQIAGSAFASGALNHVGDRVRTTGMTHRENQRTNARAPHFNGPRDENGSFPMPPADTTTENTTTEARSIAPASTPTKPTPEPTPANSTKQTLAPGRYQGVRVDKHGKPHTVGETVSGEVVNVSEKKLNSLKKLDSYDNAHARPKTTARLK